MEPQNTGEKRSKGRFALGNSGAMVPGPPFAWQAQEMVTDLYSAPTPPPPRPPTGVGGGGGSVRLVWAHLGFPGGWEVRLGSCPFGLYPKHQSKPPIQGMSIHGCTLEESMADPFCQLGRQTIGRRYCLFYGIDLGFPQRPQEPNLEWDSTPLFTCIDWFRRHSPHLCCYRFAVGPFC